MIDVYIRVYLKDLIKNIRELAEISNICIKNIFKKGGLIIT